jgi:Protein of unknown function (DUF3379)
MNCLEFRSAAGADPQHLTAEALEHERGCAACARYLAEVRELDVRIVRALTVPVPEGRSAATLASVTHTRRRYLALAASVLAAVGVGAVGWLALAPSSLAADVVEHMRGEPHSWESHTAVTDTALEAAMQRGDAWFTTMPGRFMYVQSCWFRGHYVPHLVLETDDGPVTLLLLRNESVKAPTDFNEDGYRGVLLPVGNGAVAVVTRGASLSPELAQHIAGLIQWTS